MFSVGTIVSWDTVKGLRNGVIEKDNGGDTYLVRLANGKAVLVHKDSIKPCKSL